MAVWLASYSMNIIHMMSLYYEFIYYELHKETGTWSHPYRVLYRTSYNTYCDDRKLLVCFLFAIWITELQDSRLDSKVKTLTLEH